MDEQWRIELFNGLRATQSTCTVTHFRTHKAGALLAYLAYYHQRSHAREVLSEILWPDCEPEAARHSLRMALTSLRHQLEPPGVSAGSVLVATRTAVALNPAVVTTDVGEFEAALAAAHAESGAGRVALLAKAVELYSGALLAGYYEDWILSEERRLDELFFQALRELLAHLEQTGDLPLALHYAQRGVAADPLREATYRDLMRLYAAQDQPAEALRQYHELKRILKQEFGLEPAAVTFALAREMETRAAHVGHRSAAMSKPLSIVATPRAVAIAPIRTSSLAGLQSSSALPCGTLTFLVMDSVDATAHVYQRALLRREFRRSGSQIEERDNVIAVAFSSARRALACALAIQRALAAALRAVTLTPLRMALHTADITARSMLPAAGVAAPVNDAEERALHCAMQLLRAAHPGQILCSEVTAVLLRHDFDPSLRLTDLAQYRLTDITAPERLFQIDYPGMAQRQFPPLKAPWP